MAAKRHRLAARRKTVGFTQEGLAEQLGVDPTTVRRWESGETETGPQPWLRPKLAHYLQVSVEQLGELLNEDANDPKNQESPTDSVQPQSSDEHEDPQLVNSDASAGMPLPVIVNGRLILVPLGRDTDALAAVQLESAPPDARLITVSLRGAALLSAAAASARRGDSREAHAALTAATVCAAELGQDRSDLATVFGPTNVAIHQVAIAIELGDAHGALRHIPAVQLDRLPTALTERRARFLIDVARSYAQVADDAAAVAALLQAETIAPDELRHHRLTHELVPQLLARESRTSDLRALATRCNLLT